MTQDAAQARKGGGLSVAGWPLQRKIAALLAIPLLLAATLAGLRVQSDLSDSRQAGTSAKQVTVIQPRPPWSRPSPTTPPARAT